MNKIIIIAICSVFFLSGCSIKTIEVKANDYRLETQSILHVSKKSDARVLRVQRVEGDNAVMTRSILYKQDGALKPYKYGRWSEFPSTRLQQIFTETLEAQGLFSATVSSSSIAAVDLILESSLQNFEEVYEDEKSFVHVKLRFRLIQRKDIKILGSISLDSKVQVKEKGASGVVLAFNAATENIVKDLTMWLNEIK